MTTEAAIIFPSADRATAIDQVLRDRLAASVEYLAEYLSAEDWNRTAAMGEAVTRLKSGPVCPWAFGFYAILVQSAGNGDLAAARIGFDRMLAAVQAPFDPYFLSVGDTRLDRAHWDAAGALFDTDAQRPFRPIAPAPDLLALVISEAEAALALLKRAAPDFAAELAVLHRLILVGVPKGPDDPGQFNAASTFFLWQTSILNAEPRRGLVGMVDVLVHEASHLLLFGLVGGKALSRNDPSARYASPLRRDPRPIDGIFHGAFVATRVHLAMEMLRANAEAALHADIDRQGAKNRETALIALDILRRELLPTPEGQGILDAMAAYWQAVEATQS